MEDFLKSDLFKVVLAASVAAGGFVGGLWAAAKAKASKVEREIVPPERQGRPDAGTPLHEKIESIMVSMLTLTHGQKVIQEDIHDIRQDQGEMKAEIRKAVNDRAEIKDRLGHLEGRDSYRKGPPRR